MSIQSEIERLVEAKNDIATSIENKGVTVPSNTLLSGMPSLIDQITGDVTSVNGQTGDVVLSAIDVGALASDVTYVQSVNGSSGTVVISALPSVTSSDNDKVLKVVSGVWAATMDSNEDIMIANITYSSGTYTSDKTYAQLKAVLDAGGTVYAKRNSAIYQLSSYTSSAIYFYSMSVFEQTVNKISVRISNSDVVTVSTDTTYEIPYEIISSLTTPQPLFSVYKDTSAFDPIYMIYGRGSYEDEITFQELFTGVVVLDYGEGQQRREILPVLCFKASEINDNGDEYADDGNYETYCLEKIYTTHEWDSNNNENVYTYHAMFGCFVTVNGQEKHKRFTLSGSANDTIANTYGETIYSETIEGLPAVSSSDNSKVLTVVDGAWAVASTSGGNIEAMTSEEIWVAAASGWGSANPSVSAAIWNSVAAGWSVSATMTDSTIHTSVASGWR